MEQLEAHPVSANGEDGKPKDIQCQFKTARCAERNRPTMFCGRASAVTRVSLAGVVCTPGDAVLQVAQYDFHAQVFGTVHVRAAMLPKVPSAQEGSDLYSWPEAAVQVVAAQVRILVGGFRDKDHPLIAQLSKIITL